MTPITCTWTPGGGCTAEAVAEFYQGGPGTIGFEPCWEPRCAEHVRVSTDAGFTFGAPALAYGGYLMGVRALSPACAGCGHPRAEHVYGCKGTRQSGGPSGMIQRCGCPGYAATKDEAVAAR